MCSPRKLSWIPLFASFLLPVDLEGQECPPDASFAFSARAPGADLGEEGNSLDVFLLPGEGFAFEATFWLENLTGETQPMQPCATFFSMSVVHDDDVLRFEEASFEGTDYAAIFPLAEIAEFLAAPATANGLTGFVAGDFFLCQRSRPFDLEKSMSLVKARYSLRTPFPADRLGERMRTDIRFIDGLMPVSGAPAAIPNIVTVFEPETEHSPCPRDLAIRFHVTDAKPFIRGDASSDGRLDITDAVFILKSLFTGERSPACEDAADVDDSGSIEITDAVSLLQYLFLGGAPPPAPHPDRGSDPTPDELGCEGP